MFYVYILRSINFPEKIYVGYTNEYKKEYKNVFVKVEFSYLQWLLFATGDKKKAPKLTYYYQDASEAEHIQTPEIKQEIEQFKKLCSTQLDLEYTKIVSEQVEL